MQAQTGGKNLDFVFEDLSFVKNNEYFNFIADGYTLLGNKLYTGVRLQPHSDYDIRVGADWIKYYGLNNFSYIIPSISLHLDKGKHQFYFGRLDTGNNHDMPQQIYAFERLLDARSIENGLQHKYTGKRWQSDTWLEWEHFIFKNDKGRERLNFGHHSDWHFPFSDNLEMQIPVSLLLHHRGGQINRHNQPSTYNSAIVVANFSSGLGFQYKLNQDTSLGIQYDFFVHSINSDNTEDFVFKTGKAHLFTFKVDYQQFEGKFSFWQSRKYIAPKGDDMFQSLSRKTEIYFENNEQATVFAGYAEPDRQLLYTSISYHKEMARDLHLGFVTELYYQLNKGEIHTPAYSGVIQNHLDYSMGLYVQYRLRSRLVHFR